MEYTGGDPDELKRRYEAITMLVDALWLGVRSTAITISDDTRLQRDIQTQGELEIAFLCRGVPIEMRFEVGWVRSDRCFVVVLSTPYAVDTVRYYMDLTPVQDSIMTMAEHAAIMSKKKRTEEEP